MKDALGHTFRTQPAPPPRKSALSFSSVMALVISFFLTIRLVRSIAAGEFVVPFSQLKLLRIEQPFGYYAALLGLGLFILLCLMGAYFEWQDRRAEHDR